MAVDAVAGIGKAYRRGGPTWALRDVDLRVAEGTVLGLLGPDVGGGAVLGYDLLRQPAEIRALVNLVRPTADVGIDNNLTVRQNLAFWAPIYGLHGAAARARMTTCSASSTWATRPTPGRCSSAPSSGSGWRWRARSWPGTAWSSSSSPPTSWTSTACARCAR